MSQLCTLMSQSRALHAECPVQKDLDMRVLEFGPQQVPGIGR